MRPKHVFPTNEVPHLWAHKTQTSARNAQGNLYFDGDTIYSYGSHFPIACHVSRKGQSAVLMTTRGYSSTTAAHISVVRGAIPSGVQVFNVPDSLWYRHGDTLKMYKAEIAKKAESAKRALVGATWKLNELDAEIAEANAFAKFYGLRTRFKSPLTVTEVEKLLARARQHELKRDERNREARDRREAQRAQERLQAAGKLEEWKAGGAVNLPYWVFDTAYLRVKGDEVETTQGARVPLEHVKAAGPLVRRLIEEGRTYERNGHTIHLGHYAIDSIDAEGTLRAGCHVIEKAEVLRFLETIGI